MDTAKTSYSNIQRPAGAGDTNRSYDHPVKTVGLMLLSPAQLT